MGGERTGFGSIDLLRLCDLEVDGGGPGGGGGSGMPGAHRDCEDERDLADVGVSIALADAALLAAGGTIGCVGSNLSESCGTWIVSGCGLDIEATGWGSGGLDDSRPSLSRRLLKEGIPNRLSREAPLPPAPGGGGKFCAHCGSGEGRCTVGGTRAADELAGGVSNMPLTGR